MRRCSHVLWVERGGSLEGQPAAGFPIRHRVPLRRQPLTVFSHCSAVADEMAAGESALAGKSQRRCLRRCLLPSVEAACCCKLLMFGGEGVQEPRYSQAARLSGEGSRWWAGWQHFREPNGMHLIPQDDPWNVWSCERRSATHTRK